MDFRILGPLEVVDDGRPVALGGARQRALLAILLLRRGEVVPAARLVEELYGAEPPADGREVPAGARLPPAQGAATRRSPREPCRRLCAAARARRARRRPLRDETPAGRAALAEGRPQDAAAALADALALWRGPPLADLAYEAFAQAELARLEELRLAALEDRIDADLALGRHARGGRRARAAARRHPFRERLRAPADARALPLRPPGGGARGVPGRARDADRRARHRAGPGAAGARAGDPPPGPGARPAGGARPAATRRRRARVRRPRAELAELAAASTMRLPARAARSCWPGSRGSARAGSPTSSPPRAREPRRARARRPLLGGRRRAAYWPWVQSLRTYLRETRPERAARAARRGRRRPRATVPRAARARARPAAAAGERRRGRALPALRRGEPRSCDEPRRRSRWSSSSTTSTPRTSRRCCCSASSRGIWPTPGSSCSAPTATSIPACGTHSSPPLASSRASP